VLISCDRYLATYILEEEMQNIGETSNSSALPFLRDQIMEVKAARLSKSNQKRKAVEIFVPQSRDRAFARGFGFRAFCTRTFPSLDRVLFWRALPQNPHLHFAHSPQTLWNRNPTERRAVFRID